jgi:peptidoglycan hydrolase CwlO-like protein
MIKRHSAAIDELRKENEELREEIAHLRKELGKKDSAINEQQKKLMS